MRTNIEIDDRLLKEAFKVTLIKTKKELINTALKEFVDNHNRKNLLDLKGKIQLDDD